MTTKMDSLPHLACERIMRIQGPFPFLTTDPKHFDRCLGKRRQVRSFGGGENHRCQFPAELGVALIHFLSHYTIAVKLPIRNRFGSKEADITPEPRIKSMKNPFLQREDFRVQCESHRLHTVVKSLFNRTFQKFILVLEMEIQALTSESCGFGDILHRGFFKTIAQKGPQSDLQHIFLFFQVFFFHMESLIYLTRLVKGVCPSLDRDFVRSGRKQDIK
mgnify:CR=1 FL=1